MMKKILDIVLKAECTICALLYLFALYAFRHQLEFVRLLVSILCLLIGNGILLVLLTNLINFDQNKIYGFKWELFTLGVIFQIAAFAFLKNRIV